MKNFKKIVIKLWTVSTITGFSIISYCTYLYCNCFQFKKLLCENLNILKRLCTTLIQTGLNRSGPWDRFVKEFIIVTALTLTLKYFILNYILLKLEIISRHFEGVFSYKLMELRKIIWIMFSQRRQKQIGSVSGAIELRKILRLVQDLALAGSFPNKLSSVGPSIQNIHVIISTGICRCITCNLKWSLLLKMKKIAGILFIF